MGADFSVAQRPELSIFHELIYALGNIMSCIVFLPKHSFIPLGVALCSQPKLWSVMEKSWLYPLPSVSLISAPKEQTMKMGACPQIPFPWNRALGNEINPHNSSGDSKHNFWYYTQCFTPNHITVLGTVISRNWGDPQASTLRVVVRKQVKFY